ncbi:unnamed protein product [Effrenium voratum]|uniref:RRM domain-containing protein n=1 Tax=Effrenium voratum TaxID=2562239 RepID=A0AA36N553_9DINO|nr:unnamed protein product [Effrenium voratum]CAJ1389857.1 unnamed protein product [Effrenium voratum]CAJ1423855.1 unnamed protein product [Effrenium voratum]
MAAPRDLVSWSLPPRQRRRLLWRSFLVQRSWAARSSCERIASRGRAHRRTTGLGAPSYDYGHYDDYYDSYDYDYGYGTGEASTKVFVGNLPYTVTWQQLKDQMRQVGEVRHVELFTEGGDPYGRSKGCGVVEFANFNAARRAIDYMHDTMLQGRLLYVREYWEEFDSGPKPSRPAREKVLKPSAPMGEFKVTVGNLPEGCTWKQLKDHMRKAGPVAHVACEPDGATVAYESEEAAQSAVDTLNGSIFRGHALTMEVA